MKNIRRTLGRTGCLAPRAEAMRRRYAERILKGQYPAALPGQASTKYEPGYRKPPRTAKTHVSAERCYREGSRQAERAANLQSGGSFWERANVQNG
jgi:hypothetical protein